jgi:three-Cys-motif partner protein
MPKVSSKKFFAVQTAHSRVKADLVFKYVMAWASVVLNSKHKNYKEAAYIDLFSGPGSYEDGCRSTPLLIVEAVLKKPLFREGLRTYFNDKESALTESLKQEIDSLAGIDKLVSKPVYTSLPASIALIDSYGLSTEIPQFFFLDQFGWADIMPELIKRIFLNRKCDCAFFLRTSRVIAAVSNKKAEIAMQGLFGIERLLHLRSAFAGRNADKEAIIFEELRAAMQRAGAPYFQAFPFRVHEENSPKHHLIYLGKHQRGLSIMKDIMDRSSSIHHAGVPIMGFSEVLAHPSLFTIDPIPELQADLLKAFAGRDLTVGQIYSKHHPTNSRFVLRNYQEALRRLETCGAVSANPVAAARPKRSGVMTMGETVVISFPVGSEAP